MQHFYVSQGLAEQLPTLLTATVRHQPAVLRWYGHLVPTISGTFAVFMEDQTRYSLVMQNPPSQPQPFHDAFLAHLQQAVFWLTQVNARTAKRVAISLHELATPMQFSVGLDYAVSADLFDLACQLQFLLEDQPLVTNLSLAEAELARRLNFMSRVNGAGQEVLPVESFRAFWCRRLGISLQGLNTSLN